LREAPPGDAAISSGLLRSARDDSIEIVGELMDRETSLPVRVSAAGGKTPTSAGSTNEVALSNVRRH
jgi:hypothetical protein